MPHSVLSPVSILNQAARIKRPKKSVRFDIQGTAKERVAPAGPPKPVESPEKKAETEVRGPMRPTGIPPELLIRAFPGRRSYNN